MLGITMLDWYLTNNNHFSSHEQSIIKKRKKKENTKKHGRLDQNPYVNKNDRL